MRYFTLEALNSDAKRFQAIKDQYWKKHFSSLQGQIPPRLYHFHQKYSLHDCVICSVSRLKGGKDLGIVIDGVTNGPVHDTASCVYFLHFIDATSEPLDQILDKEIHVVELDLYDKAKPLMRILHRDADCHYQESEFIFSDFDFYISNSNTHS